MGRPVVIAAGLLVLSSTIAIAAPKTTKVTIETDPPHAKLYFGTEEEGEICTTPCTIDAPVGETAIILEAENHQSKFENLIVPRKQARPYKFNYTLELAIGTLVVSNAAAAGATIRIDDEDKGKAPGRVEDVPAGPHHVTLVRGGKEIYGDFIEIAANQELELQTPKTFGGGETGSSGTTEPGSGEGTTSITTSVSSGTPEPKRTTPYVVLMAVGEIGFRQFSYQKNQTPDTVRDESEGGQAMVGPVVELYPTTLLGLHTLPGLFLYGRAEFHVNPQTVQGMGINHTLSTFWQSIEISVKHRWVVSSATVEVGAGYARDRYDFTGEPNEVQLVPAADYNAVKISAKGSLVQDWFEPYLEGGYHLVVSDGALGNRYALGHSVNGIHGALGAIAHLGAFQVRAEAGITMYTWALNADTGAMYQATGATDLIESLSLSIGYAY